MAAIDLGQFHELAEQFMGEIPLKKICEREDTVSKGVF